MKGVAWTIVAAAIMILGSCAAQPPLDLQASLEESARAGNPDAQFKLGKVYCCGNGPGKNSSIALSWLCKAAKQDHPGAQYEIGRYYALRTDTYYSTSQAQARIYAYMWYSLASVGGWPMAAAERDALAQDMSRGELTEAQSHIREWRVLGCRDK